MEIICELNAVSIILKWKLVTEINLLAPELFF